MADKSLSERVADKRAELEALEREEKTPFQEYPKWVTDPTDPSKGYTVASKEQEDAVLKGLGAGSKAGQAAVAGNTFELSLEEQEAAKVAKAEADKAAAHAQSRLAGPEKKKADKSTGKK